MNASAAGPGRRSLRPRSVRRRSPWRARPPARTARAPPARRVTLTPEEEAKIKEGKHTAAPRLAHARRTTPTAVDRGAKDEFARLGIEVVAVDRRAVRCRQAEERHRDDHGQEAEHHPVAARRSRYGSRGLPAGARGRHDRRLRRQRAEGFRPGQGLRDHRLGRPRPDGREGGRRDGRRDRRQGQGRLPLPRRQFLRHQPARPGVQGDDPGQVHGHRDRRRAGPRRSGQGRGHHQRLHDQEPRPRRRSM